MCWKTNRSTKLRHKVFLKIIMYNYNLPKTSIIKMVSNLDNRSVHVKKTKFEFSKNFFLVFFLLQIWIFFSEKKTQISKFGFFYFRKKKPNLNLVFFSYEFGFFLKKTVSDTYLKCFLQKKSKFIREKDQIQIWCFFSEIKKTKFWNLVFFSEKKIQIWRRKKNKKKI